MPDATIKLVGDSRFGEIKNNQANQAAATQAGNDKWGGLMHVGSVVLQGVGTTANIQGRYLGVHNLTMDNVNLTLTGPGVGLSIAFPTSLSLTGSGIIRNSTIAADQKIRFGNALYSYAPTNPGFSTDVNDFQFINSALKASSIHAWEGADVIMSQGSTAFLGSNDPNSFDIDGNFIIGEKSAVFAGTASVNTQDFDLIKKNGQSFLYVDAPGAVVLDTTRHEMRGGRIIIDTASSRNSDQRTGLEGVGLYIAPNSSFYVSGNALKGTISAPGDTQNTYAVQFHKYLNNSLNYNTNILNQGNMFVTQIQDLVQENRIEPAALHNNGTADVNYDSWASAQTDKFYRVFEYVNAATTFESLNMQSINPLYEVQLAYGTSDGATNTPNLPIRDIYARFYKATKPEVADKLPGVPTDFIDTIYDNPPAGDPGADSGSGEIARILDFTNPDKQPDAINSLLNFGLQGVPQAGLLASNAGSDAIMSHVSGTGSTNGFAWEPIRALSKNLWAVPLYNVQQTSGFGMGDRGAKYGMHSYLYGLAVGIDTMSRNHDAYAGLTFNMGTGKTHATEVQTGSKNDFDFYGGGIYGGVNKDNFSFVADLIVTHVNNNVRQKRESGNNLSSDIKSNIISLNTVARYLIPTQFLDFTPHVGARYISAHTRSYKAKSDTGGTYIRGSGFDQDLITTPFGMTFSKTLDVGHPMMAYFDATLVPAFGDKDVDAKMDVGLSRPVASSIDVVDDMTYKLSVGIDGQNKACGYSIGYTYSRSDHLKGHLFSGSLRYAW